MQCPAQASSYEIIKASGQESGSFQCSSCFIVNGKLKAHRWSLSPLSLRSKQLRFRSHLLQGKRMNTDPLMCRKALHSFNPVVTH